MFAQLSWLTPLLMSIFAFIIILVPLVVFHEFGHFIFAKIFGVKAEVFSVGFGPILLKKQFGETEFRISAVPLGGYVKLLGEDRDSELSKEDQKRALHKKEPWKRFFIFLGGPLFNFILAIFIFMAILLIGEPQVANVVGRVVPGSDAHKAGFRTGDRILAVDGKVTHKFEDILIILNESPETRLTFKVLHPGEKHPVLISAKPTVQDGYSIYGENKQVGEIEGLYYIPRGNQAGVSNTKSPAGVNGLRTGSKITKINEQPIKNWEEVETSYDSLKPGMAFKVEALSENGSKSVIATFKKPILKGGSGSLEEGLGLYSSELFIEKVTPKSPADQAGLKAGDRIVRVGGQIIRSFFELKDRVQALGEKGGKSLNPEFANSTNSPTTASKVAPFEVEWEREGKLIKADISPTATQGRDVTLKTSTRYTIGIMPMLVLGEPTTVVERVWNPFKLVAMATERMVVFSWRNLISLKKMVSGDVSMGTLSGPLMIGKIAGESLARGLIVFLTNMAIFSVGLGVLNILPVPVLDGGHLLLLGIESVRGKPLTIRQMEIVQGVGLVLILTLMGIAFHNDIARLIYS